MQQFSALKNHVFGYDVFISYSRKDGSLYAAQLAEKLSQNNISCFIDQWGTQPGEQLPEGLLRTLKRSKVMVLLYTESSAKSLSVKKELEFFSQYPNKLTIPIDFSCTEQAIWMNKIKGLARTNETKKCLKKGKPSQPVINRIINTVGYNTINKRFVNTSLFALMFLLSGLLIGLGSLYSIKQNQRSKIKAIENQISIKDEERSKYQKEISIFFRKYTYTALINGQEIQKPATRVKHLPNGAWNKISKVVMKRDQLKSEIEMLKQKLKTLEQQNTRD